MEGVSSRVSLGALVRAMEIFDLTDQALLVESPERHPADDSIGEFELAGEMRWLIRLN
jgi:hypothetical protein